MRIRPAASRERSRQDSPGGFGSSLEDQDAVVVELDHRGLPGGALVEPGGVIGIIVGDPFPDLMQEVAALAEDAAEHPGDGEDELAVRDLAADGGGDPGAGGADAAHVAGGAEVASLAREGHQLLVSAVGALEAGESGGEVAATVEGSDRVGGVGVERTVFLAVVFFVSCEELVPAVVDDLPEGRCPGAAGLVDGGHRILYL